MNRYMDRHIPLRQRVRLRDVASAAGFSVSAVSHALNGTGTINHGTAEKIRRIAADLSYRPDMVAASLRRQRTSTLGVLTSFLAHPFQGELLARLEREAVARELSILVGTALAGLIVFGDHVAPALAYADLPVVVLYAEEWNPSLGMSAVEVADGQGVSTAVDHLVGLGHRTIALMANRSKPRRAGFRRAIEAAGIFPDPGLVVSLPLTDAEWTAAERLTLDLLSRRPDVSAVVATSDAAAFGVLRGAHLAGREVPKDLSVVGFDDISLASTFVPALTTIRQPTEQLAGEAMLLLDELMDGRPPRSVRLTTELVVRETSSRCAR
jgi:LacI family transcriptional regulator